MLPLKMWLKKLLKIYQYPPCRIDVISNKTNDPHPLSPTEKNPTTLKSYFNSTIFICFENYSRKMNHPSTLFFFGGGRGCCVYKPYINFNLINLFIHSSYFVLYFLSPIIKYLDYISK